ncbi:MAG: 3-hydroxyacyl-CoA dehydrogenase/enoyl-CoA hydratase family protein [Bacteroidetes bacterium]|nr:3-hydroxyacyl-CoA dehydrogenase/enoyl-CoA hydratase family protein [Bacteroidota bacterium]
MPHSSRHIHKAAVLGAGIMGSRIALHLANAGVEVLLLDMVPRELLPEETRKGLTEQSPAFRNRIVTQLFQDALKSNPSPVYTVDVARRVSLGNFSDDLARITDCDWVVEVVVERLDIKQNLYTQLEQYRKPGSLITTNTSGIPMHMLAQGRSDDFRRHFCGTHFFNPPRYLELLEIIPAEDTAPDVVDFLMHYGDRFLGKRTVLCKDTPAFIANRVGIYAICHTFHLVEKYGLRVEEVDRLTGPLIGHPKSATFRTCDLVGLDTAAKVAAGIAQNCPQDEARAVFALPEYVQWMVDNQYWGDKSGKGFYQKAKSADGKSEILSLDLKTRTFGPQQKPASATLSQLKTVEEVPARLRLIAKGEDSHARFLQELFFGIFAYVSHRVPEIADHLYQIDEGIKAGFGWGHGAFEKWDILGVARAAEAAKAMGYAPAAWVDEMLAAGHTTFYKIEQGKRLFYDPATKSYLPIPGADEYITLDNLRQSHVLWSNVGSSIFHLGDGILCVEFHSKMNTLGSDVLGGIHRAIDMAEQGYRGLVIGNQGEHFSAGANLAMVFMMAVEQEWDELDFAVRYFQRTTMRARYSSIPVVVAPHGLALGGGCELTLHADAAMVAAETYMGLVEVGVGLIPGGGGTKELTVRMSDEYREGDVEFNAFTHYLMAIAQAKVSTSGPEGYAMGLLRRGRDQVTLSKRRQIADAARLCRELADAGYTQPIPRTDIRALGRGGLGATYAAIHQMHYAGYASAHDKLIAEKVAYVMCGGDLSQPGRVSEQYLLDLERQAFLSLLGERKTLERIQHMLNTGKPLRN